VGVLGRASLAEDRAETSVKGLPKREPRRTRIDYEDIDGSIPVVSVGASLCCVTCSLVTGSAVGAVFSDLGCESDVAGRAVSPN
jgi:hypothetical protein